VALSCAGADSPAGAACWVGEDSCAGVASWLGTDSWEGVVADAAPEVEDSRGVVDSWVPLDCGAWAGGLSAPGELLVDREASPELSLDAVECWALLETPAALTPLSVFPGKALAVSTPVRVALAATIQRLQRASRRSAASRDLGV
jgi:hypothetical protein